MVEMPPPESGLEPGFDQDKRRWGVPAENNTGYTLNETIPAEDSTRLEGDYRDFPVPPAAPA